MMSRQGKVRLDVLLTQRGLAESRSRAQALIMSGQVKVDGRPARKPGQMVSVDAVIEVEAPLRYVSRGGLKLEAALDAFQIRPEGWVCADVGASTGGFTDCLLQRGAARVYAIDVGYGQLAWSLRQDERVVVLERTNARYLTELPGGERVDLATVDASFISLQLLLPTIRGWLKPGGIVIPLIKPQFEAGRDQVGRGGVVRAPEVHRQVLKGVLTFGAEIGLHPHGLIPSPIRGPAGNVEFLACLKLDAPGPLPVDELIRRCLAVIPQVVEER